MSRLLARMLFFCGYGDVRKGCADALQQAHARIIVNEISSICALTALMEGVLKMKDMITVIHIRKMKDNAIFFATSITFIRKSLCMVSRTNPGVKCITVKCIFPETNTDITVLAEGHLMNFLALLCRGG
ncbi:hypothetical protein ES332_A10G150800v1 [Gossypium tomentosum]|uniref:Adenosylhomocysteinase n=1 Tax=Gossypium tomentosum TaxID=34277 RepID=A0A5D2NT89_GOSTO|nr:hypothetical protein ES332_A10G150800v1 [Gossypium tomentosum]